MKKVDFLNLSSKAKAILTSREILFELDQAKALKDFCEKFKLLHVSTVKKGLLPTRAIYCYEVDASIRSAIISMTASGWIGSEGSKDGHEMLTIMGYDVFELVWTFTPIEHHNDLKILMAYNLCK